MKKLILIDGNSLLFRAFYATSSRGTILKSSKGLPTNALFGFTNMMLHILDNYQFSHILVAFDAGKTTFRHEEYKEYKGTRKPIPQELIEQIPLAKQLLDVMRVKRYELNLYEADDIIGTLSLQAENKDFSEVEIISSDKDLLQLVSDKVHVSLTKKGLTELETYTIEHLFDVYGLTPEQIIDLKGLMGDASDNIPGIPGVGEKTALKLLHEYGSVENLIAHVDNLTGKLKESVENNTQQALLSKRLATINRHIPLDITLDDTLYHDYDYMQLLDFFRSVEFHSLVKKMENEVSNLQEDIKYELVLDVSKLNDILLDDSYIIIETFGLNYHKCEILGMAVVNEKGNFFIPRNVFDNSLVIDMFLRDPLVKKNTFDLKKAKVALNWQGFDINGVNFDLLIASYIINPAISKEDFRIISSYFNYHNVQYDEEIYGKNTKYHLPDANIYQLHAVKKAYALKKLKPLIIEKLKENDQLSLYLDLELPLSTVLAEMEYNGIKIDRQILEDLGKELTFRIKGLESEIYKLANKTFNIASPKQLGEVLFEDLHLPVIKKTKTGYSTNSDVLEKLFSSHPIIEKIMEYRTITKLHSTYVEGLKPMIFNDQKIHTIFNQALTATGRLSSIEPNLQNIPIRYEEGRQIRKCFIPDNPEDYILSADYSQIELRILAHLSSAHNLIEAFNHDLDIHTKTAMDIFGVSKDDVTPLMRRQAKAVNFGIIYGISAFGLSENLGIDTKAAEKFIDKYLCTYPGIKDFMENIVHLAKINGYVETIFKRRRYIPELTSKNYNERSFGERTAMNAPIQGSAADIIKIAMINVSERLKKEQLQSKLLIQVHDELIFTVKKDELEIMKQIVKEEMENAVKLQVPLKVDINYGHNWYDAK
ncbi:MAG TPA: DNA polymerase I [Haloplasmataceae bacterium]